MNSINRRLARLQARTPANRLSRKRRPRRFNTERLQLYRYFNADGALLYVGITGRAYLRYLEHREFWIDEVVAATIERLIVSTWADALQVESATIRAERPRYNIQSIDLDTFNGKTV